MRRREMGNPVQMEPSSVWFLVPLVWLSFELSGKAVHAHFLASSELKFRNSITPIDFADWIAITQTTDCIEKTRQLFSPIFDAGGAIR